MPQDRAAYFQDLFFSQKGTGSVAEYWSEVSGGRLSFTGDIIGPYTLPRSMEYYANGESGLGGSTPNAQTMAVDTIAELNKKNIDLKKYNNKGRAETYVDGFIIVHAGQDASDIYVPNEKTAEAASKAALRKNLIWSMKYTLPDSVGALYVDGTGKSDGSGTNSSRTRVYPFLTVAEDAKLGVIAHEMGHLLFGWPDFYDTKRDTSYSGAGPWCLMSRGGRIGDGTKPCHPSAWCKLNQDWVNLKVAGVDSSGSGNVVLYDVKSNKWDLKNNKSAEDPTKLGSVHKLWSLGANSTEYFLIENRGKTGFDALLPAEGLLSKSIPPAVSRPQSSRCLVWHVDDSRIGSNNSALGRYHLALVDAGGKQWLDFQDYVQNPFPGSTKNTNFTATTRPNSNSYDLHDTFVAVRNIAQSGPGGAMTMSISVNPGSKL